MTRPLLLDANNEDCADGNWHPAWRAPDPDGRYFYNRPSVAAQPAVVQVARFYLRSPLRLSVILSQKVIHAFLQLFSTWLLLGLVVVCATAEKLREWLDPAEPRQRRVRRVLLLALPLAAVAVAAPLLCYSFGPNGTIGPAAGGWLQPDLRSPAVWVLIALLVPSRRQLWRVLGEAPRPALLLLLNFLLIVLIFYGTVRFVVVIDFVLLSLAFRTLLDYYVALGLFRTDALRH